MEDSSKKVAIDILHKLDRFAEQNAEVQKTSDERELEIELGGRKDFFQLRKKWSGYLFWFLLLTLIFQFFVAISIGIGLMSYPSETVVNVLLTESFIQIVGLVFLVVKFLFSPGD